MKLTVVGCAGSYPSPDSPPSCYLIEHDGASLVLDMGNGALGQLQRYIDPVLDDGFLGLVLSHCHIDHCADAGSLYVMRHYGPRGCRCSARTRRRAASWACTG
jgi:ribonuclease BN (tRNA processing enzyme)